MPQSSRLTEHDHELIRSHPLFSGLEEKACRLLVAGAKRISFSKNEAVFEAGDEAGCFYIIASGAVRLYHLEPNGNEATVNVFRPPQSFGEAAFFLEHAFPVNAQAVSKTALIRIDARAIVDRIREDPSMALGMLASMSQHLKQLVNEITLLRTPTATGRLAEFLLRLGRTENGPAEIELPYTKVVIAKRLGITPEALSRAFADLRERGVQVRGKMVRIDDVGQLGDVER